MKPYSVTRRLIAHVLILELAAAIAIAWLAVGFETHARFRAFDIQLAARADSLFGAVGDADDAQDNVALNVNGLYLPKGDLYEVKTADGRVLGRSAWWPAAANHPSQAGHGGEVPETLGERLYHLRLMDVDGKTQHYRLVVLHAVRVVDPGRRDGGVRRAVIVSYAAPTAHVWSEIWEAVRFYAFASLLLLMTTGLLMGWLLRRALAPLRSLAEEAEKITARQWQFHPQESARSMVELAPLTLALESTLQRLERSFAQQTRFTSDAAHELKTDLAIAKSSLQLLMMRPRSAEAYAEGLEVCLADTERLERTVTEMLTLARVEQPSGQASVQTADALAGARRCMERLAAVAELRQVHVVLEAPQAPLTVNLNDADFELLCTNLLLNALEHSGPGSTTTIDLRQGDGCLLMAICDEGEGIAPSALPHVFEPFYRGDAARERRSGSTGLGLAICHGLCRQAGGAIAVESTPGVGTQVRVRLLLAPPSAAGVERQEADFSLR